jgi:hypothetical protein
MSFVPDFELLKIFQIFSSLASSQKLAARSF